MALSCTPVFSSAYNQMLGKFCMEKCNSLGRDPLCEVGETCVQSNTAGRVCFNPSNPQQGYTTPGQGNPSPSPPPTTPPSNNGNAASYEKQIAERVNTSRAASGLGPLTLHELASNVARQHSQDMCSRGYFSHQTPEGLRPWDRLKQAGISFSAAGENIAKGQSSPEQVHNAWMNSSGHRANILNASWTHIGVGYVPCNSSPYWTQVFLR
jgi:uncharacterized protein YkwD